MMVLASIRWRLQAWHGLILVAVLSGFGLTAYQVAHQGQMRRIDQDLERRAMELFRAGPPDEPPGALRGGPPVGPPPGPPPDREPDRMDLRARVLDAIGRAGALAQSGEGGGYYYVAWAQDGSLLARSLNSPTDVPRPEHRRPAPPAGREDGWRPEGPGEPPPGPPFELTARSRGEWRELAHFLPDGLCVLVGRSINEDRATMRRLAYGLAGAGTGVLLLGLAGGWWLATRAIRPIDDISATALRIAAGDLSQRINTANTDDELGRLANVLNATFARLEAAFAQQAQFTSDASHELRTPVAVVLSQTQTALARERSGAEYREALAACQRAAERMRGLTESLLELARLEAGEERMRRAPFDLSRAAGECVELVRPLALARGIQIRCELPTVRCNGDADRIGQVITNLLTNAIDFNREGGEVRMEARNEHGASVLTITDSGEGIRPEDVPHVFERFYRVDRSRSGSRGRTGLGLAICKAVVDAHSGTLEVASQFGVGSTFTLRLPSE
jgi:two-component system OmpR family sensor kinase